MLDFKLIKGDTIGIVCPSGPLSKPLQSLIYQGLINLGYEVKLCSNYGEKALYLAGNDTFRLNSFLDVWLDPKVKLVWAARGGFGASRLLESLPFKLLNKNFKPFIGMSDITALHLGFSKFNSPPTFLGPTLSYLFSENPSEDQKRMRGELFSILSGEVCWNTYLSGFFKDSYIFKKGVAEGLVIGGNLCVLTSLIGTPWEAKVDGNILLLEDINEPLYKIDRMLFQCEKAGLFKNLKGLILASFENFEGGDLSDLYNLFSYYFKGKNYPIVFGSNCGHLSYQKMIPLRKKLTFWALKEGELELKIH